jgi:glycosyltransferase involved in cell wall biosynthesis
LVLVFVPTLNDHDSVAEVLAEIGKLGPRYRVLVVDDGSDVPVRSYPLRRDVLTCELPDNFGLGVCTHVAFDHALRMEYDAVVRVDADGQHPVHEIPALLAPLQSGDADIVVGTRTNQFRENVMSGLPRRIAKYYFNWVARLMTRGLSPSDVNSGFFAVTAAGAAKLNAFSLERFPEPQLFVLACRAGLRLREIPIKQFERRRGRTTLNMFGAIRMFYRFNVFVLGEMLRRRST